MTTAKLTREEVIHVANLANLPLTDEEIDRYGRELSETLSFIDSLHLLDPQIKDLPATYQVTGKTDAFREDLVKPSLSQEEALKNGKNTSNGYFVVPSIWN